MNKNANQIQMFNINSTRTDIVCLGLALYLLLSSLVGSWCLIFGLVHILAGDSFIPQANILDASILASILTLDFMTVWILAVLVVKEFRRRNDQKVKRNEGTGQDS